jgi:hypothetical protein
MTSKSTVARPRAGDIGKPRRRFTLWPKEVPVPVQVPTPAPAPVPAPAPIAEPETEPAEVTR